MNKEMEIIKELESGTVQERAQKYFNLFWSDLYREGNYYATQVFAPIVPYSTVVSVMATQLNAENLSTVKNLIENVTDFNAEFYYEDGDGNYRDITKEDLDDLLSDYKASLQ